MVDFPRFEQLSLNAHVDVSKKDLSWPPDDKGKQEEGGGATSSTTDDRSEGEGAILMEQGGASSTIKAKTGQGEANDKPWKLKIGDAQSKFRFGLFTYIKSEQQQDETIEDDEDGD